MYNFLLYWIYFLSPIHTLLRFPLCFIIYTASLLSLKGREGRRGREGREGRVAVVYSVGDGGEAERERGRSWCRAREGKNFRVRKRERALWSGVNVRGRERWREC